MDVKKQRVKKRKSNVSMNKLIDNEEINSDNYGQGEDEWEA